MEGLLPEFEQQFATVSAEITAKICQFQNSAGGSVSFIGAVNNLIDDAKELLERMELEVREAPQDQREKLMGRVKSYEVELKRLEKEFLQTRSRARRGGTEEELRQELMGPADDINSLSIEKEQRQRLLDNTETLERTSVRLAESFKISIETEQVGAQILEDLHSQREVITRSRQRLRDTDEEIDQSWRILSAMMRRVMQHKFVLLIVVVVIILMIVSVIYVLFQR